MKAPQSPERVAIVDSHGDHTYGQLFDASRRAAAALLAGRPDLAEARVALFIPPGFDHVAIQWGVWRAGGIVVPLALSHPPAELEHVLRDAGVEVVVSDPASAARLRPLAESVGARLCETADLLAETGRSARLPTVEPARRALIVYTSGTTGKPKGVVTTHANIEAQIAALIEAWGWTARDRILLVLPLHHVHGIVNVVGCALWAGATCEMLPRFDAGEAWTRLCSGSVTVFTAVPTIYRKLIDAWHDCSAEDRLTRSAACRGLRLMISGSAALPVAMLEEWKAISGHTLLERYGMTELGMALSNPLTGERRPGFVGMPLPNVEIRLVDEQGVAVAPGAAGQIEVQGPNVFLEYWGRPEETRAAFHDGWFCTGDTAVVEEGYYRILGRSNVDIIKTGGFKVSALEIEEELRSHPAIAECAVVGLPDPEWGERIGVAIELRAGAALTLEELREWSRSRLAPYKLPRVLSTVASLPRNNMGKVIKPEIRKLF